MTSGSAVKQLINNAGRVVCVDLDYPPSLNNLFINIGRGRAPGPRYKAWREAAAKMLMAQRARAVIGPVEIRLIFEEKSGRHDIDNLIKPVLDCLVENGIIAGDSSKTVRRIEAVWGDVAGVRVEIAPASEWIMRREAGRA